MCEKITETGSRRRLEYGAVPLQPWSASHPDMPGENYYLASLRHIRERLDANFHIPVENGTIHSEATFKAVYDFCDLSLTDAHVRRITHHHDNYVEQTLFGDEGIIEAAHNGTATPDEMLRLLSDNPHIGAAEIAKLSHPFDGYGDKTMMEAVYRAIDAVGGVLLDDATPRFKTKRTDTHLPALVVLRKQPIACMEAEGGVIEIIARKSLLVRGDADAVDTTSQPRIDRLVKQIAESRRSRTENAPETQESEATLHGLIKQAYDIPHNREPWLDVLTTSVYAVYRQR